MTKRCAPDRGADTPEGGLICFQIKVQKLAYFNFGTTNIGKKVTNQIYFYK